MPPLCVVWLVSQNLRLSALHARTKFAIDVQLAVDTFLDTAFTDLLIRGRFRSKSNMVFLLFPPVAFLSLFLPHTIERKSSCVLDNPLTLALSQLHEELENDFVQAAN